jgi:hypothetical protein
MTFDWRRLETTRFLYTYHCTHTHTLIIIPIPHSAALR